MIKVAFGRCNLPHYGHVKLINEVDFFILSDAKKNTDLSLRLELLKELGADISKVLVGSPYKILKALHDEYAENLVVVVEEENEHLPVYFGCVVEKLVKDDEISSTLLRKMSDEDFEKYYGAITELAKLCRKTKKYSKS
jgi:hypothetical protein